jgi:hypothetical protein
MRGLQLLIYLILLVQELLLMLTTAALCRKLLAAGFCTDFTAAWLYSVTDERRLILRLFFLFKSKGAELLLPGNTPLLLAAHYLR